MKKKYSKRYKVNPDLPFMHTRCFYGIDNDDTFVCKECEISNTTDTTVRFSSYLKKSDCVESWTVDLDDLDFKPEAFWISYTDENSDMKIPMFVKRDKSKSTTGEIITGFGCLTLLLIFFAGTSIGLFALLVWIAGKILHLI